MFALLLAAAVCPGQSLAKVHFTSGEKLAFRLDAVGVDVGTFDVELERGGKDDAAWTLRSRAKTNALVSTNIKPYDAFVSVTATREFLPIHYREDLDEGQLHKSAEIQFPAKDGMLDAKIKSGDADESTKLGAGDDTREVLTTLFVLRAQPLKAGVPVCLEAYAGRHVWKVEGSVAALETIETPLGRFATARIDTTAVRTDDPNVRRAAHVWVTQDERRLPVSAIAEVRGKTIRATLVEASSLRKPRAQANEPRRNAIGR